MAGLRGNRFHQEALDLLGDARFRTIRQHCLMHESLKKKDFTAIPWRESDVRQLLNRLRDEEVTLWDTIRWFSKKFGILDPQECIRLKNKKASLEEELVETTTKPQRKAAVPSKEVLWALEEGATLQDGAGAKGPGTPHGGPTDRHAWGDAFILAITRFQVGCSARFNDLQHVHPQKLSQTSQTLELQAWQTKTVSATKIRRQPVPLICPKYSFTGHTWWLTFEAMIRKMTQTKGFEDMDYLIPTINKEYTGFIARPCNPDRALRWLKDALVRRGAPVAHVQPLSWFWSRTVPSNSNPSGPTTIPGQLDD